MIKRWGSFSVLLVTFSLSAITQDAVRGFKIATDLFNEGEYEESIEQYKLFLNRMGDYRGEALFRIGECNYNLQRFEKALENFKQVYREYPETYLAPEAMYGMILTNIALKDWKQAENTLVKLTSEFPGYRNANKTILADAILSYRQENYNEVIKKLENFETREALFYIAKSYFFLDKTIEALSTFKKITEKFPEDPLSRYSYYYMGDVLFFTGDYEGALYKYNDFLEKYPYSRLTDYAKYKLAVCYFNEKQFIEAVDLLKPLLNNRDKFLAAHSNLLYGECMMEGEKYGKALTALTRVISNFPDLRVGAQANLKMGETFLQMQDTTQARIVYQQMASRYTTGELAGLGDYLAGAQLFTEELYLDARDYFTRILKLYWGSEVNCSALAMLLRTYREMADYELSIALGTQLLKENACQKKSLWKGRTKFYLAEAYYIKSRYNKAKRFYREILDDFSEPELVAPAMTGLGWCLLHEERYDVAEKQFKRVISAYNRDTNSLVISLFGEGVVLYNRGEFQKALDYFEQIPGVVPLNPLASKGLFYAGKCYYNLEYYRQGIESWERVLSNYHYTGIADDAAFQIGQTYFQALEYDQAVAYFNMVLKEYPESPLAPRAQRALGNSYYNNQDYSGAVREFSKFIRLFPEDTLREEVEQSLSSAYYMLGQKDPEVMREFIQKFPGDKKAALAQFNLGIDAYEQEDYDKALKEFKKVIINFPETEYARDAQINIMKIYEDTENYEKIVKEAEHFIDYFPDSKRIPLAVFYKGLGYFYLNNYKKAAEAFDEIVKKYPDCEYASTASYNLSQCYKKLGRTEEAASGLRKFGRGEGKEVQAKLMEGATYQENGEYKKALQVLMAIEPENDVQKAELYTRRGECLLELNRRNEAIREYGRLMSLNLKNNKYQMQGLAELAGIYEGIQNIKKAKQVYRRLLEVTTDEKVSSTVRKRLNYLNSEGG